MMFFLLFCGLLSHQIHGHYPLPTFRNTTLTNVYAGSNFPGSNYPESHYPGSEYPESNYPGSHYPESAESHYPGFPYHGSRYPESHYPESRYPESPYHGTNYPGSHYPESAESQYPGPPYHESNYPGSHYPRSNSTGSHYPESAESHYPESAQFQYPGSPYHGSNYPGSHYPRSNYTESHYPESRYPDSPYHGSNYPETYYPASSYPESNYPESPYHRSNYPGSHYPESHYPGSPYHGSNYARSRYPGSRYPASYYPGSPYSGASPFSNLSNPYWISWPKNGYPSAGNSIPATRSKPVPKLGLFFAPSLQWHVGIYSKSFTPYMQVCGGSLVKPGVVLSAAHCFWNDVVGPLRAGLFAVAAGKLLRPWETEGELFAQHSDVKEIKIPPRFQGVKTSFQDDIAVVLLSSALEYVPGVMPVCVSFDLELDRRHLTSGNLGTVAGWGLTEPNGLPSQRLNYLRMPYVDIEECFRTADDSFLKYITSDKICAGDQLSGRALCRGDSGGGLVFYSSSIPYLHGIASTAPRDQNACNARAVATFTHVLAHRAFLITHVPDIEEGCEELYFEKEAMKNETTGATRDNAFKTVTNVTHAQRTLENLTLETGLLNVSAEHTLTEMSQNTSGQLTDRLNWVTSSEKTKELEWTPPEETNDGVITRENMKGLEVNLNKEAKGAMPSEMSKEIEMTLSAEMKVLVTTPSVKVTKVELTSSKNMKEMVSPSVEMKLVEVTANEKRENVNVTPSVEMTEVEVTLTEETKERVTPSEKTKDVKMPSVEKKKVIMPSEETTEMLTPKKEMKDMGVKSSEVTIEVASPREAMTDVEVTPREKTKDVKVPSVEKKKEVTPSEEKTEVVTQRKEMKDMGVTATEVTIEVSPPRDAVKELGVTPSVEMKEVFVNVWSGEKGVARVPIEDGTKMFVCSCFCNK